MIKYSLRCAAGHEFEGWFGSIADFDRQAEEHQLSCPACGSADVGKAIMAPAVATSEARAARLDQMRTMMMDAAQKARTYVEKNFDYVGERFPEEARAIHYGEKEERRIYGEASGAEVRELVEEGIAVAPVPGVAQEKDLGKARPAARAKPALN